MPNDYDEVGGELGWVIEGLKRKIGLLEGALEYEKFKSDELVKELKGQSCCTSCPNCGELAGTTELLVNKKIQRLMHIGPVDKTLGASQDFKEGWNACRELIQEICDE